MKPSFFKAIYVLFVISGELISSQKSADFAVCSQRSVQHSNKPLYCKPKRRQANRKSVEQIFPCQQTQTKFLRVIIKTIFIQNLVKSFVFVGFFFFFFFFYILVMLREQCLKQVVALRTEHSKRWQLFRFYQAVCDRCLKNPWINATRSLHKISKSCNRIKLFTLSIMNWLNSTTPVFFHLFALTRKINIPRTHNPSKCSSNKLQSYFLLWVFPSPFSFLKVLFKSYLS